MEETLLKERAELRAIAKFISDKGLKQKSALCNNVTIDYFRGTIIYNLHTLNNYA